MDRGGEGLLLRISQFVWALDVAPSGFLCLVSASGIGARPQRDRRLRVLVRTSFDESHRRYGSPRVHEDLLDAGHSREPANASSA